MRSLVALVLLAGCGSSDAGLPPLPTDRPLVWFSPLKRQAEDVPGSLNMVGTTDFMDLFQADAPWAQAAAHVQVFKVNCGTITRYLSDDQLRQIIVDLERRGMYLAVEGGPLIQTAGGCGDGIEGFVQDQSYECLAKVKQQGGHVRYFAMDEPFDGAVVYTGPNDCHWSNEKLAMALKDFLDGARVIEPELVVGDIESLWAGQPVSVFTEFMDAYESVTGEKLPFFHYDIDYSRADWAETARDLEDAARARGIDFGVIYDGRWEDASDAEWTVSAADTFAIVEGELGGRPDHVIFQSWELFPEHNLPEDQADTFTHLIDRYFGTRTALTVSLAATAAQGTLTGGEPGASITLTLTPLDGPGDAGDLTVSGSVPAGVTMGLLQVDCGNCDGPVDIDLYRASYVEGGGPNLVPNPDFADGLAPWYFGGTGTSSLEPSDQGSGDMLHLVATVGQTFGLNSGEFAVTPSASYTADFTVRVSPASVGSGGYVTVIFLNNGTESTRLSRPLATATLTRDVTAGAGGAFQTDLPAAGVKRRVDAAYQGDAQRWPAFASATSP